MITLGWKRLFRAEQPSSPQRYVDRRPTARTITPPTWPCQGPDCAVDTGSDVAGFCSDRCQSGWHYRRLFGGAA